MPNDISATKGMEANITICALLVKAILTNRFNRINSVRPGLLR